MDTLLAGELKALAYRLIALASGGVNELPAPEPAYPRVEVINGAQFDLKAAVNPAWQPSQYARIFGSRQILPDPSNAESGQASRSPAGYPLVYLVPGRPARVLYGDSTFDDDAQVERFRAAVAESMAGALQRDVEENNRFRTPGEARAEETEIRVEQG
jgi:hypothetical protein